MVDPLIRTPMAMIASKAFFGVAVAVGFDFRSVVLDERRSEALMPSPAEAWTWDAA
jgi:hypothetical protein